MDGPSTTVGELPSVSRLRPLDSLRGIAALAVAIGYRFPPDQVQVITITCYLLFSILGGIWFALSGVLENIGKFTPTYQAVKISTDVIGNQNVPPYLYIGLLVWLVIFAGLATLSVRSMAEQV